MHQYQQFTGDWTEDIEWHVEMAAKWKGNNSVPRRELTLQHEAFLLHLAWLPPTLPHKLPSSNFASMLRLWSFIFLAHLMARRVRRTRRIQKSLSRRRYRFGGPDHIFLPTKRIRKNKKGVGRSSAYRPQVTTASCSFSCTTTYLGMESVPPLQQWALSRYCNTRQQLWIGNIPFLPGHTAGPGTKSRRSGPYTSST